MLESVAGEMISSTWRNTPSLSLALIVIAVSESTPWVGKLAVPCEEPAGTMQLAAA
jgi:hypothetical protein